MTFNEHNNINNNNSNINNIPMENLTPPCVSPRLSGAIHIKSNSSNDVDHDGDIDAEPHIHTCNEHKEDMTVMNINKRAPSSSNIPRIGSGKSLSSISSVSSCTSNQTKEIYENLNMNVMNEDNVQIPIHHLHKFISITPPAISPQTNMHNMQQHNEHENNEIGNEPPPILSALTTLYTTKYETNVREVDVSPHSNMEHQDLKHLGQQNHATTSLKTEQNNAKMNKRSKSKSFTSTIWSSIQSINPLHSHSNDYNTDNEEMKSSEDEDFSIIHQNEEFMDNAIKMYGHLDDALSNINALKLQKIKLQNMSPEDTNNHKSNVNNEVIKAMKTLLSSTTKMSGFFMSNNNNNDNENEDNGCSLIGRSLDKLSSSIAYMSYISISRITPFIYNMVEAVLLELYATIKDVIEYYDSDPKNNILYRLISKMNEIIEAIHGLLALSECFYEINSDETHNDDNKDNEDGYNETSTSFSLFEMDKKVKKD